MSKKKFSSFAHFLHRRQHLIIMRSRFLNFNKKWILVIIFLRTFAKKKVEKERKIHLKCQLSFKMQERATTSAFGLLFIRLIYRMCRQNWDISGSCWKFLFWLTDAYVSLRGRWHRITWSWGRLLPGKGRQRQWLRLLGSLRWWGRGLLSRSRRGSNYYTSASAPL